MGLTSYYPIDRSSIINMPEVVKQTIIPLYEKYSIVQNINTSPIGFHNSLNLHQLPGFTAAIAFSSSGRLSGE